MAPKGFPTTTTEGTPERTLVTGGDPNAPFPVPFMGKQEHFRDAPELAAIGAALIAACEEFEDLKWAIEETGFRIGYYWKRKASAHADKVKAGTLTKAGGLVKHTSEASYVVQIAADVNRFRSAVQIERLVFHELLHIRIERKWLKRGDDEVAQVPVLKTRAHDAELFLDEIRRYGYQTEDQRVAKRAFDQLPLLTTEDDGDRVSRRTVSPSAAVVREAMTGGDMRAFVDRYADSANPVTVSAVVDGKRVEIGPQKARERSPNNRSGAKTPDPEGLGVSGESPVSVALNASQTHSPNGSDDADAIAGILLDPDRVMAMLTARDWKIAYLAHQRGGGGVYVNPATGDPYDTEVVENAFRAAMAGRS